MNESLALSFFLLSYFVCLKFYQTLILALIVKHRQIDLNLVNVTLRALGFLWIDVNFVT